MGSPVASFVSGPGTADTNAMRLLSGDHAMLRPTPGSGLLVPCVSAINRAPLPSGCAMTNPDFSPDLPLYAIHCPSGDHSGFPEGSFSAPKRTLRPLRT